MDTAVLVGLVCTLLYAANGDIGPGVWRVLYIKGIQDDSYKVQLNITQHKHNRTHDVFDAYLNCMERIDEKFGIVTDICIQVDGGCKPYQRIGDDSIKKFVENYAKNNAKEILTLAEADPPELPLEKGMYHVKDYMFDYSELPSQCPYGQYFTKTCMLEGYTEVCCIEAAIEFVEVHGDSGEESDEER